jgi:hypothetical protein
VAEDGRAVVPLACEAALQQLGHSLRAGQGAHQVEVEGLAGDGGRLGRRAALVRQLRRADQDGVAHGVRQRHLAVARALKPVTAGLERAADPKRAGELLHEEGRALRGVVDRAHERRRWRTAEQRRQELAHLVGCERLERELLEAAGAAQLVSQPPQPVVAR